MKKVAYMLLMLLLLIGVCACAQKNFERNEAEYKLAVVTRPMSEDTVTFAVAQQLAETYKDTVVTVTYPHNYHTQPELTVAMITDLANDPDIRVIVFPEVVEGTAVGIKKLRETRSDILIITGINTENAAEISPLADVCLTENKTITGTTIIEQSISMGAEAFVYISCQTDLDNSAINTHGEVLKETCSTLGLPFIEAIAPDPTGAEGVLGTQAWFTENIPLLVEMHGKNIAFYATNEAMSIPLVQQVAVCGAILPQLCNPSPYHAFPEAFDIDLVNHEADLDYLLRKIKQAVATNNNQGRMASWSVSQNIIVIKAGVEYGIKWCDGVATDRCDRSALRKAIDAATNSNTTVSFYTDEMVGTLSNAFAIKDAYYVF